jgi:sporulation-control protein spo0M
MIDPTGRVYQLVGGSYVQSEPILDIGFEPAVEQVGFRLEKFEARRGDYFRSLDVKHAGKGVKI